MINYMSFLAPTGRLLIALNFFIRGWEKLAAPLLSQITSAGLPAPYIALAGASVVEAGGAILLALGFQTRIIALILAGFSVITALAFHHNFDNPGEFDFFLKNIAIAGGLLHVAALGAGPFSIDSRRNRSLLAQRSS